ncbi:hypothetical protein ED733_007868 [Metarhizium rileyi]|uniref:Aminotransferase class I/classII large domain-containing protein n=1 Tax=Metarhizium rileyi (strain RCEF 4871) TaxID=1649241 RepID=A0A5C6GPQ1_METRR|nr:hypothetical protein ED733_007868 [Metarhizium rileyi]
MLSGACQQVLAAGEDYVPILQYGPSTGHPTLKNELSRWLGEHYNVNTGPDRICVTGGASQGLSCILQSFTDPNYTKAIWIVAPCYYLACGIFEDSGFSGKLRAVPEDEEGLNLGVLRDKISQLEHDEQQKPPLKSVKYPGTTRKLYRHVVYIVPTCANPSGKTMSLRRREELVKMAREKNILVVCDDVYDFLQWFVTPKGQEGNQSDLRLPRLCDIERAMDFSEQDPLHFGYTISNGSFSKIAGPGVRTGWVEATSKFVTGLGDTASTLSGGAPSQLCAAILGESLRSGYYVREESLPVADAAVEEENLAIGYGRMFEVRGDEDSAPFRGDIRISFAWEAEEAIVEGIQRLGSLLKRMLEDKAQYESGMLKLKGQLKFVDCYK